MTKIKSMMITTCNIKILNIQAIIVLITVKHDFVGSNTAVGQATGVDVALQEDNDIYYELEEDGYSPTDIGVGGNSATNSQHSRVYAEPTVRAFDNSIYGCNEVITDNNNHLRSVLNDQDLEPLGSPEHKFDNSIYGTETDNTNTYSQATRSIFPPSRPPVIYDTVADKGHYEPVNFKRIENSGAIVTELKAASEHVYSCID